MFLFISLPSHLQKIHSPEVAVSDAEEGERRFLLINFSFWTFLYNTAVAWLCRGEKWDKSLSASEPSRRNMKIWSSDPCRNEDVSLWKAFRIHTEAYNTLLLMQLPGCGCVGLEYSSQGSHVGPARLHVPDCGQISGGLMFGAARPNLIMPVPAPDWKGSGAGSQSPLNTWGGSLVLAAAVGSQML